MEAQSALAHAIGLVGAYDADDRVVEEAVAERIEAIAALQRAIETEPRVALPSGTEPLPPP